jgi:hypothetical protein
MERLHPSKPYILVKVIPSYFHFVNMCLCQVSLLLRCSLRYWYLTSCGSCIFKCHMKIVMRFQFQCRQEDIFKPRVGNTKVVIRIELE